MAGGLDASPGGEGPRATAVLRDEVRTRRASHRPRGFAAIREALSQTPIVLLATQAGALEGGLAVGRTRQRRVRQEGVPRSRPNWNFFHGMETRLDAGGGPGASGR